MTKKLTLKTIVETIEVTLDKGNGTNELVTLREFSAAERDGYLALLHKRMTFDKDGKPIAVNDHTGLQSELLSLCLYRGQNQIKSQEIATWASSTVEELFKAAQRLNRLTADKDDDVKKD